MKFRTTVLLGGTTATGLPVPPEVVEGLGAGKRPPVRVTIGSHTYRSTVAPRGGAYLVPLSAENRAGAGGGAGGGGGGGGRRGGGRSGAGHRAPGDQRAGRSRGGPAERRRGPARLRTAVLQPPAAARAGGRGGQGARDSAPPHREDPRDAARGRSVAPAEEAQAESLTVAPWWTCRAQWAQQ